MKRTLRLIVFIPLFFAFAAAFLFCMGMAWLSHEGDDPVLTYHR